MIHRLDRSRCVLILLLACLLLSFPSAAESAEDPVPYVRVGIYWGDRALEGANLLNYSGSGYALGYFDEDLQFVPLMRTEERAISMLKDWSLYYVGGQYVSKGSSDNLQVGCYHIRLGSWESCEEAMEEASDYSDGFVGYINGTWYAFCGSYLSQTAAENAASSRGIFGTAATASSRCVTVVATGTDRVIFQYDGGTESSLGVMPLPDGDGGRPITWFRGYKYYGGFQYTRRDGGNLTVVNVLEMDDYICGVVPYEMSPSWPMEALKAQAVSARTYAASQMHKHESSGFDLCNSTCCQAYLGVNVNAADCEEAVRDTSGIYVTYEGEYADTYYHSCDGGATENSENVFYEAIPYLKGVRDPYESYVHTGYEHWSYVYTADEITWILQNKGYKCSRIVSITPTYTDVGNILSLRFTDSAGVSWTFSRSRAASILNSSTYNRIIHSQRFTVTDGSSEHASVSINDAAVRVTDTESLCAVDGSGQVHSIGEMGSFAVITGTGIETVTLNGSGETIVSERFLISGSGWGHNVGMSQYGAKAMAEMGFTYDEILKFYFTGVDVG